MNTLPRYPSVLLGKKMKRNNNNNSKKRAAAWPTFPAERDGEEEEDEPLDWPHPVHDVRQLDLDLISSTARAHTRRRAEETGLGGGVGCEITAYLSHQAVRRPITDLISRSSGPVESLPFMRRQHSFSNIMGRLSFFLLLSDAHYSHDRYYFFPFFTIFVSISTLFFYNSTSFKFLPGRTSHILPTTSRTTTPSQPASTRARL